MVTLDSVCDGPDPAGTTYAGCRLRVFRCETATRQHGRKLLMHLETACNLFVSCLGYFGATVFPRLLSFLVPAATKKNLQTEAEAS